jgi:hypothetical protein
MFILLNFNRLIFILNLPPKNMLKINNYQLYLSSILQIV